MFKNAISDLRCICCSWTVVRSQDQLWEIHFRKRILILKTSKCPHHRTNINIRKSKHFCWMCSHCTRLQNSSSQPFPSLLDAKRKFTLLITRRRDLICCTSSNFWDESAFILHLTDVQMTSSDSSWSEVRS